MKKLREILNEVAPKSKYLRKENALRALIEDAKKLGYDKTTIRALINKGKKMGDWNEHYISKSKKGNINQGIEQILTESEIFKDYLTKIRPHLSSEENKKFAEKLAQRIYGHLNKDQQICYGFDKITHYILNLGFINIPRVSNQQIYTYTKKYKSLFKDCPDAFDRIADRWVEEEIAKTPRNKTDEKIAELKEQLKELYK